MDALSGDYPCLRSVLGVGQDLSLFLNERLAERFDLDRDRRCDVVCDVRELQIAPHVTLLTFVDYVYGKDVVEEDDMEALRYSLATDGALLNIQNMSKAVENINSIIIEFYG